MTKYIDADLLQKEINRRIELLTKAELDWSKQGDKETLLYYSGKSVALDEFGNFIDSLTQEQSKIDLKVDLNEEIERFIDAHYHTRFDETLENGNDPLTVFDFQDIARHFYELGFKARK